MRNCTYRSFLPTIHLSSNILSFAQPLIVSGNTHMNTPGDSYLRTFGDATGVISAPSSPTTPSESPMCSPLILSSTPLPVNLPELAETPLDQFHSMGASRPEYRGLSFLSQSSRRHTLGPYSTRCVRYHGGILHSPRDWRRCASRSQHLVVTPAQFFPNCLTP